MNETMTAVIAGLLLLTAASASAQDSIEDQLDTAPSWTTDIQPPWSSDSVEDTWESEGYEVDD